ncbi:hypothetical protein K1719_038678 [Acacia pycnantha]|nr:hypothetical protein K1719_038678 [Acacia pycnantha]
MAVFVPTQVDLLAVAVRCLSRLFRSSALVLWMIQSVLGKSLPGMNAEKMKKRLYKAWENAVIVKLLGRNIGYKILLSILQSLWARRGVIRLINIGNGWPDYTVEYEGLHGLCTACGVYGHHADHCNSGKKREAAIVEQDQEVEGVVNGPNVPVEDKNKEQDVWRIVQKPRRRRNENKSKEAFDPNSTSGSRFEVLIGDKEKEESRLGPVNLEFSDPIDMEPLIIPNPDILPNVTTPLDPGEDGPFVDPGPANALVEPGPASALVGKFWMGQQSMDPDCSMVP